MINTPGISSCCPFLLRTCNISYYTIDAFMTKCMKERERVTRRSSITLYCYPLIQTGISTAADCVSGNEFALSFTVSVLRFHPINGHNVKYKTIPYITAFLIRRCRVLVGTPAPLLFV